jgi:hypothetical protein
MKKEEHFLSPGLQGLIPKKWIGQPAWIRKENLSIVM